MNNNYNLAISEYVNSDDENRRNSYILKTLLMSIVLVIIYTFRKFVFKFLPKMITSKIGGLAIFTVIMACLIIYVAGPIRVFNKKIRQGKLRILTIIFVIIFVYAFMVVRLPNMAKIFEFNSEKILLILFSALLAGIIEELLFRCLIFNLFLVIFENKQYILIWSSLCNSILFGLMHFINLMHQSLHSTIGQVVFAITLGLASSYFRIISNNLIYSIIVHVYIDFNPVVIMRDTGSGNANLTSIFVVSTIIIILALICIWLFNERYNEVKK